MKMFHRNSQIHNKYPRQSGVVLVIGLVLILVITLIAIAGLSNSAIQTKLASNAQQHNDAFQAAESALSHAIIEIEGVPLGGIAGNSDALAQAMELGNGVENKVAITYLTDTNMTVSITYSYLESSGLESGISLNADENSTMIGQRKFILEGNALMSSSGAKSKISQGISYE